MRTFLIALLALCLSAGAIAQAPNPMVSMSWNAVGNVPSVPFGGIRLWDSSVTWAQINTSSGNYSWTLLDSWRAIAAAHNVDILYTFGWTPNFISSNPTQTCEGGLIGCAAPPSDVASGDTTFKAFVTALVNHSIASGQRIKYYEIWNEPNLTSMWSGTQAQLLIMANDAYSIIHTLDPSALVVGPACSGGTAVCSWLLTYWSTAGGSIPQDITGYHGYLGDSVHQPTAIPTIVSNIKVKQGENGLSGQAIWFTEGSWGQASTYTPALTNDEQVAYMAQEFLYLWNGGVQRFYWYAWDNTHSFGPLWNSSTGILPAGTAYGILASWMAGESHSGTPCSQNGTTFTWTCSLTLGNGRSANIVWNPSSTVSVSTSFTSARQVDSSGTSAVNGSLSVGSKPMLLTSPYFSGNGIL